MGKARVKYILLIVPLLFGVPFVQAALPEIPVPPMPAARKAALGVHKLIPAASVTKLVSGLRGNFNKETGIAFINGRVHPSCVSGLSLAASPRITVENSVPFALMASDDGLKCLERTHLECVAEGSCVSLQTLSRDPKTADRFKARVDTGEKVENVKVTLSKKALVQNDKTVRLEATADCCNVANDPLLGDEQPLPAKEVQEISQITNALMAKVGKVHAEDVEPAPANNPTGSEGPPAIKMPPAPMKPADARSRRAKADADDEDKDDQESESGEGEKRKLAPGMQRVATDEEIDKTVAKNMLPYYKQYYEGLLQAQQFQYQSQLQMMQFQMSMAQQNKQTTTNAAGYGNLLNYNWSALSSGLSSFAPNWANYTTTTPSASMFTLPTLGNDRGR